MATLFGYDVLVCGQYMKRGYLLILLKHCLACLAAVDPLRLQIRNSFAGY